MENLLFNLPDARGRVLGAIGTGVSSTGTNLTPRSLGDTVGAETHTLTVGEMPSHNHEVTDTGHSHTLPVSSEDLIVSSGVGPNDDVGQGSGYNTGSSTTGIIIDNTGGGGAHNNMQPTEFIGHVFIFAKYLGI